MNLISFQYSLSFQYFICSHTNTNTNMELFNLISLLFLYCLFILVESRAIPTAERDEYGLQPHQRVCLYIRCPESQSCVSVSGVPQCQVTHPPTPIPPCEVYPCEGAAPVCDQFGTHYQSECSLRNKSCNSTAPLTVTECPQATDCAVSVRTLLFSYTSPSLEQVEDWAEMADGGTLQHSDIRNSVFPSCDVSGRFTDTQCYSHIPNHQFCWCVAPETGGYRDGSFQSGRINCTSFERNCSLRSTAGEVITIEHGQSLTDTCSTHSCSHGELSTKPDSTCLLCPPPLLSLAKEHLFSQKATRYSRLTERDPSANKRRTLAWYFSKCDRNRGGEVTKLEFSNCHRNISPDLVSDVCKDAVFEDCSGLNSDSILPSQWQKCFNRTAYVP